MVTDRRCPVEGRCALVPRWNAPVRRSDRAGRAAKSGPSPPVAPPRPGDAGRGRRRRERAPCRPPCPSSTPGTASPAAPGADDRRARLHPRQRRAVHRRRGVPGRADRAHHRAVAARSPRLFAEERERGIYDVDAPTPVDDHRARARLHRPGPRADRRPADRRAAAAGDHAQRRAADGRGRPRRPTATSSTRACSEIFTQYRKTHNDGVFDAYTAADAAPPAGRHHHRPARRLRPRPHHRRLPPGRALRRRPADRGEARPSAAALDDAPSTEDVIRDREELAEQIRALGELEADGRRATATTSPARPAPPARRSSGCTSPTSPRPRSRTARRCRSAAPRRSSTSTSSATSPTGRSTEARRAGAHRRLRHQAAHHPVPAHPRVRRSCSPATRPGSPSRIGGMGADGRPLVTRTIVPVPADALQPRPGPGAEPDRAVVAARCRRAFKRFCAQVSLDTSAIQYENDDLIRPRFGDDTAIACCVSAMRGRQGHAVLRRPGQPRQGPAVRDQRRPRRDHRRAGRPGRRRRSPATYLDYDEVLAAFDRTLDWLAETYVDALNVIHYMHDKYAYERLEMALHDYPVRRFLATGIAGLSVAADSLSAIRLRPGQAGPRRHRPGRRLRGRRATSPRSATTTTGPTRSRSTWSRRSWTRSAASPPTATPSPTLSVLTITSNVVYGKHTGNTPDGRRAGEPFAPGANPMNGRDRHGLVAAALSVAKLPYDSARDGISLTTTVTPDGLGRTRAGADRQPGRDPRRLHRRRRLPHERQRARPRDAARTRWRTRSGTRS